MEKQAQNIQEAFLNNARKDKTFLTIYLMSGVKLSGRIKSFDKYSVVLETNSQEQLIFKHAISTVVVSRPYHSAPQIQRRQRGHPCCSRRSGGRRASLKQAFVSRRRSCDPGRPESHGPRRRSASRPAANPRNRAPKIRWRNWHHWPRPRACASPRARFSRAPKSIRPRRWAPAKWMSSRR